MSKVANLVLAGKAVGEVGLVIGAVVANGTNYVADLVYIPKLFQAGKDVVATLKNYKADLAEITTLDEDGRAEVAAAWQADVPELAGKDVQAVIDEGIVIITYGLEAIGFFISTFTPAPAA